MHVSPPVRMYAIMCDYVSVRDCELRDSMSVQDCVKLCDNVSVRDSENVCERQCENVCVRNCTRMRETV